VGLRQQELGLPAGLLLELLRRALRGDERRAEQRLQLAEADELALEVLDLVSEVGAVAPDVLVALRDLFERGVDECALVAEERALDPDVLDLDGRESHGCPSLQSVEDRVQELLDDQQGDDREHR
jgi:hypothetical protein